ncbi:hypothetical protein Ciccas_008860 [Cichlidogyrus casuarinus]|uniref:Maturase K n=1 Tax=Cichlidogyrus casuarinus TaxID=1844966 RepID=A0ABD2PYP2_9PLAT
MDKTYSVWNYLRTIKSRFMSPFYEFSNGAPDFSFVELGSGLRRFSSDLLPRHALSKQLFQ